VTPLEELRSLVYARTVLDLQIEAAAVRAVDADVSRTSIAHALGVSRAHLYRTVLKTVTKQERAELL
jgi:hypothetical protein